MMDAARRFLEAAVMESRNQGPALGSSGPCGLGETPTPPDHLSEAQRALLTSLSPRGWDVNEVMGVATQWIRLQDGLDRKRNHFLKAFRQEHGFVRRDYSAEVLAQYQAGLDAINTENDERLAAAATRLLTSMGVKQATDMGSSDTGADSVVPGL